jgi:ferredoxin
MIVTSKKKLDYIKDLLKEKSNVIIVGCSECAAVCQTGGSEQVKEMAEQLSNRRVLATISIESPCDKRIASRDFRRIEEELAESETIVALTCGSGVQAIHEVTGKPVIAALNTHFLGMVERLGRFYERCSHCGDCMLNDTADICPVTLCPKGIRNGPCEGIEGTKCEVDEEKECAWYTIYEKLKERGELESFSRYHEPVDWSREHSPKEEIWEKR